ncbi:MAG: hypothetical protein ABIW76_02915 [Fibrobacteria bacterium]
MKIKMGLQELAQYTYQGLKREGIEVTLSGGACVSIYTDNAFQSGDLDFIRQGTDSIERVSTAMTAMGFKNHGRHFTHPDSELFVEFPRPPLTVGEETPKSVLEYPITSRLGRIKVRMLSPTDCIKDRLCGFYYWNDLQSLDQAVMVAKHKRVDGKEIERWSKAERMSEKHAIFKEALAKKRKKNSE